MFEKKIIFKSSYKDILTHPVPIKKLVPEWFKKLPNFNDKVKNYQSPTLKKCIPLLDSLTSGYAILNTVDTIFWLEKSESDYNVHWRLARDIDLERYPNINIGVETHDFKQISSEFIKEDEFPIPFKFLNPWVIETPKGYSCLFVNPLNSSKNRKIRTFDAIVDTDTYNYNQVNFPFLLKKFEKDETFLLKEGEPIILVFPFKRDNWKMEVSNFDNQEKFKKSFVLFNKIVDNYKFKEWKKKSYD